MDDRTLIILTLLEAILVVIVVAVFLFRNNRKLRQQVRNSMADGAYECPACPVQEDWLAGQLERTELRLASLAESEHQNPKEASIIHLRQRFLSAERQAAEMGRDDEHLFWRVLTEALSTFITSTEAEPEKQGLDSQREEEVANEVAESAPADSTAGESQVESGTTASRVETVNQSGRHMSEEVESMREVVTGQGAKIQEMGKLIGDLRLEVDEKDRLKQITAELEGRSIDLSNAVDRLEQENNFLQAQISALLQQEISKDEQFTTELQRIEERLASKEAACAELEKKCAAMEQQYLDASNELEQQNSG